MLLANSMELEWKEKLCSIPENRQVRRLREVCACDDRVETTITLFTRQFGGEGMRYGPTNWPLSHRPCML